MKSTLLVSICFVLFVACSEEQLAPVINVQYIETPTSHSGQSRLTTDASGQAYLSWIEYTGDIYNLQYSKLSDGDTWSQPITITSGKDWFVNWADFPALAIAKDGSMAAHWLQMRDVGTYDYDVTISTSQNGTDWKPGFIPHRDSIAAEHGFVSMAPSASNGIAVAWLDGRHTKTAHEDSEDHVTTAADDHGHGHGGGAMSLRTADINHQGEITEEFELDNRICDCCQTDMAMTEYGPIIVYRDRSKDEVRDISVVRKVDGAWTEPRTVYNDEWQIHGCPVNGPAIATDDANVAVSWYTGANDTSSVFLAFSNDNGANFDLPIRIDQGQPLGRVDVLWVDSKQVLVTWLEKEDDEGTIMSRVVSLNNDISDAQTVIKSSIKRSSGFPILTKDAEGVLLTWTDVSGDNPQVKTARII